MGVKHTPEGDPKKGTIHQPDPKWFRGGAGTRIQHAKSVTRLARTGAFHLKVRAAHPRMARGNTFVDREGRPKHDLRRTKQRVESGRAKDGWGDEVRNHLFNDFQYAQAATIAVKLIYGSGRLSLKIRDNGKVPAVDDHPLLREVRRALLLSASTTIALSGLPAVAQRAVDVDTTLQEVTVTGSYIPRTDSETPSTVEIMTGADIANGGLTSVADVVRTISADNSGTLPTAFPGAFAAGASGVALRGLTVNSTLVLIDGLRAAAYALPDDGV